MNRKKMRNPLQKRVPKELIGEWRKYLVIFLLLAITIGFVSGMYVANNSMLSAIDESVTKYEMEYGHFELNRKADADLLAKLESGEKADVWAYATDEARKEADKEIEKKSEEQAEEQAKALLQAAGVPVSDAGLAEMKQKVMDSQEFKDAVEKGRKEAYEEIDKKLAEEKEKQENKKSEEQKKAEENFFAVPVKLYENFYKDVEEDHDLDGKKDGKVRVYKTTDKINHSCYLEGEEPKTASEIAIDRMHADNNSIKVGDTIRVQGKDMKVTGLIAMVNYSTLYEKNTDSMFDAITFDVAVVTVCDNAVRHLKYYVSAFDSSK